MQLIYNKSCYKKYKALQLAAKELRQRQTSYEEKLWGKIRNKQLLRVKFQMIRDSIDLVIQDLQSYIRQTLKHL